MADEIDFSLFDRIASSISKINTFQLDEEDQSIIEDSKLNMAKLCKIEHLMRHHQKCLEKTRNAETEAGFTTAYNSEMSKMKSDDLSRNERYKDFLNSLNTVPIPSLNGTSDPLDQSIDLDCGSNFDEIIPEFDPITKQALQNPVRNTICKHVYEKRSIEQSLQINKRLRCPIAGCSNTKHITLAILKEDHALRQKLLRMRNEIP